MFGNIPATALVLTCYKHVTLALQRNGAVFYETMQVDQ